MNLLSWESALSDGTHLLSKGAGYRAHTPSVPRHLIAVESGDRKRARSLGGNALCCVGVGSGSLFF